jgi:hypothetical protein
MASIIKADNIQKVSDGTNIIKKCGSTITLGSCGATISLACGATQTGFGRTGTVDWCTTAKTAPFTGVSGNGYFVNTTCGAVTVTLPASPSAGDIISIADYASTWQTNAVTLCRNSSKINGGCFNPTLNTVGQSITLVYVDGTRGWKNTMDSTSNVSGAPNYIIATGGTITCCGDYKIHTFTSDGTFTICSAPTPANNNVDYVVVAGGGGGGGDHGGGGGAGGYRESYNPCTSGTYCASPLASATSLPISVQAYPVTVGGGGAGGCGQTPLPQGTKGVPGSNSIFSTITSAGGGGGAKENSPGAVSPPSPNDGVGIPGGSGGGGSYGKSAIPQSGVGGSGNTPPVSPPQGNPGGLGDGAPGGNAPVNSSGGGGGAGAVGGNVPGASPTTGGAGGAGVTSNINGSPVVRAGGGGGAAGAGGVGGAGGSSIGGAGSNASTGGTGTVNTGSGGGGAYPDTYAGGAGGSGIVVIRYKFQ